MPAEQGPYSRVYTSELSNAYLTVTRAVKCRSRPTNLCSCCGTTYGEFGHHSREAPKQPCTSTSRLLPSRATRRGRIPGMTLGHIRDSLSGWSWNVWAIRNSLLQVKLVKNDPAVCKTDSLPMTPYRLSVLRALPSPSPSQSQVGTILGYECWVTFNPLE